MISRADAFVSNSSWKDKILDSEIETACPVPVSRWSPRTWKDKILDYEIETSRSVFDGFMGASWKDKILDYEIETGDGIGSRGDSDDPWKDKILDYEIETPSWSNEFMSLSAALKR